MSAKTLVNALAARRIPTDEELMELPKDGYKRELLHGEIILTPAGSEHGCNIGRFIAPFATHVYQHNLGEVFDGQTGFRMKSLDLLSSDISFVSRERLLKIGGVPQGFFEGAPDLVVEVLSPSESKKRLREKLAQYFENGASLAWVMDSQHRTVAIHHGPEPDRILTESDFLSGETIVPGFTLAIATIFAGY